MNARRAEHVGLKRRDVFGVGAPWVDELNVGQGTLAGHEVDLGEPFTRRRLDHQRILNSNEYSFGDSSTVNTSR